MLYRNLTALRKAFALLIILLIPFCIKAQNVGIGTKKPTNKLSVSGNADISGRLMVNTLDSVADARLIIRSNTESFGLIHTDSNITIGTWVGKYGIKGGWLGTYTRDNLVFFTDNSGARLVLDTNGTVGINTEKPNSSSIFDAVSTNKGILIPRMTAQQRDAIVTPASGLLVFVTTDSSFYFRGSNNWRKLSATGETWNLGGNAKLTGNFLGSLDTAAVRIRTNNIERITVDSAGRIGIGTTTPKELIEVAGGDILVNEVTVGK